MIRSDSVAKLGTALCAAQGEFEAVNKTAANPFFKSSYSPLPEVVRAASPILAKHGLAVWQGADVNDHGHDVLWTVVLHGSGEFIGSAARMHPVKNDPQALGSATTYARRYSYQAGLGLVSDEDDDGNAASGRSKAASRGRTRSRPTPPPVPSDGRSEAEDAPRTTPGDTLVTDEQLEIIATTARRIGLTPAKWKALTKELGAGGKKSNELTEDEAAWAILKLTAMERERAEAA